MMFSSIVQNNAIMISNTINDNKDEDP